jgi:hypothetical protein
MAKEYDMDLIYIGVTVAFFVMCIALLGLFGTKAGPNGREG